MLCSPIRLHYSRLASIVSRSSILSGKLDLGKLSETVIVVGNAPHDRPGFLVSHLIGNRASFLGTKAPMPRVPEPNFLHGITLHGLPAMRKRRVRGRWQALPRIPMRQMLLRLCEEYVSAA